MFKNSLFTSNNNKLLTEETLQSGSIHQSVDEKLNHLIYNMKKINFNYKILNTKINELIKHVIDVEFELQNSNYIDVDYKDNMEADYFADDTVSSHADFHTFNTH